MVEHDPVSLYSFETDFKDWNLMVILAKKYNLARKHFGHEGNVVHTENEI